MKPVISVNNLEKSYPNVQAVRSVSFEILKGEMFGLVGPDGAGKTSTIRVLCGLTAPNGGEIHINGLELLSNKKVSQDSIGYLSQKFSIYSDLSVDENIEFFAEIHGVIDFKARRDELLTFTRMIKFRDRPAGKLSGGMKQKLALCCALIHKPQILFLDEPTIGVDPVSRRDFWKILSDLLKTGMTIVLSTPYLDEAERCSRIALMNEGNIIAYDTPENVKKELNRTTLEIICSPSRRAYALLKQSFSDPIQLFGDRVNILLQKPEEKKNEILELLEAGNITIEETNLLLPNLENVFIYLVEQDSQRKENNHE